MKWFALIFSLYIIFLLTLPCVDDTRTCAIIRAENVPDNNKHQSNDMPDECSPFCFCSCCSISVVLTSFHFECKPVVLSESPDFPTYKSHVAGFIPSVWQPPKIV
jgi:hypothetical protein